MSKKHGNTIVLFVGGKYHGVYDYGILLDKCQQGSYGVWKCMEKRKQSMEKYLCLQTFTLFSFLKNWMKINVSYKKCVLMAAV